MIVTPAELLARLDALPVKGAKIATVLTETFPPLLKKDRISGAPCPFEKGVSRLCYRQVTLGCCYENVVNRQRLRESIENETVWPEGVDYFTPEKLWKGMGVRHTRFSVRHRGSGKIYLAVKPAQRPVPRSEERGAGSEVGSEAVILRDRWRDLATGRFIDDSALENLLPVKKKNQRQDLEHDVQWRTIALEHVIELHCGEVYVLNH